nr:hypothetical protein [Abalone asfa-like virus]
MAKKEVKIKTLKSSVQDKDIGDIFQSLLGHDDPNSLNLAIVWPKYLKMKEKAWEFIQLFKLLPSFDFMVLFLTERENIRNFHTELCKEYDNIFSEDDTYVSDFLDNQIGEEEEVLKRFSATFQKMEGCNIVKLAVQTCSNLVRVKRFIEDSEKLSDLFLTKSSGLIFAPIPNLPSADFKSIYTNNKIQGTYRYTILLFLHKLYTITYDVYKISCLPNIDVNEFVNVVIASMEEVKKQIPRCELAFAKIADSVKLLQTNFSEYYKDFVSSKNPTVIIERFVVDVANTTKTSAVITHQFRQIINYYKMVAAQHAKNPKLQILFQHIDKNFNELSKISAEQEIKIETAEFDDPGPDISKDQRRKARKTFQSQVEKL